MTASPWSRGMMVIMALVAVSTTPSVRMAQASPPSEVTTASGGTLTQSGNCPNGQQQDEHCLPGGPANPLTRPGGPIHPPVTPPITPPVIPPIVPPPGIPSATRPQDPDLPQFIHGWATATFHIHDDDRDVTYTSTSDPVKLLFQRRDKQGMKGNTQYVLAGDRGMDHMTWDVKGRVLDCTVEGKAFIWFPKEQVGAHYSFPGVYTPLDPTRLAFGYLNVVGPDGGDFHSVIIQMFDPKARLTKTCPGDPPLVTEEKFEAGYLLHILWQQNTRVDGRVIFQGHQEYDQGDPARLSETASARRGHSGSRATSTPGIRIRHQPPLHLDVEVVSWTPTSRVTLSYAAVSTPG
jgi:hypothetical protein